MPSTIAVMDKLTQENISDEKIKVGDYFVYVTNTVYKVGLKVSPYMMIPVSGIFLLECDALKDAERKTEIRDRLK